VTRCENVLNELDDARHGTRHTTSPSLTAHHFRQMTAEGDDECLSYGIEPAFDALMIISKKYDLPDLGPAGG